MELAEKDQPPEHMWLDDEALEDHFQRVRERHRSGSDWEEVPDAPMEQNELTRQLKG